MNLAYGAERLLSATQHQFYIMSHDQATRHLWNKVTVLEIEIGDLVCVNAFPISRMGKKARAHVSEGSY